MNIHLKRVLLINPPLPFPYERYLHPHNAIPLGLLVLATALEKKSFDVSVLDLAVKSLKLSDIYTHCLEFNPNVIGISLNLSYTYEQVKKIANFIKGKFPSIPIWIGGNHATHLAEEIMENIASIDGIALYLGEVNFPEVCRKIVDSDFDLHEISNILYRDKNRNIIKTKHHKIPKLEFHFFRPAWHLLDLNQYREKGYIIGTRGCPFQCQFCSSHAFYGSRVLYRDIEAIIDDMIILKNNYNVSFFKFIDDSFTINKNRVFELCEKIASSKEKFEWSCNTRIDLYDKELFLMMKKAGCRIILFGIESLNDVVLKMLNKNYTEEQALSTLMEIKEIGINTELSFVIGLPQDTFNTLNNIIPFVHKIRPLGVAYNILKLYPGTEFFNLPQKYYLKILHENWSFIEHVLPMAETPNMNSDEQLKTYVQLVRNTNFLYDRSDYLIRNLTINAEGLNV